MIKLTMIPKEEIEEKWSQIRDWVISALGMDKSFSVDDVKQMCLSGRITLWLILKDEKIKGFLTTSIIKNSQIISAYAPWLGGESLDEWVVEGFSQLKDYLRSQGCIQFSWVGRKAWSKLIKIDSEQCSYLINL